MDDDPAALRDAVCVSARDGRRSCGSARGSLRLRARWTTILRLCAMLSASPREMDDDPAALREALCVSARDGRRSCGSARGCLRLRARWTTILRLCAMLSASPREMDDDPAALREALCVSARDGRRSCGSARGCLRLRARWTAILRLCARLSASPREMDDDPAALRDAVCVSARDGRRSCGSARGSLRLRARWTAILRLCARLSASPREMDGDPAALREAVCVSARDGRRSGGSARGCLRLRARWTTILRLCARLSASPREMDDDPTALREAICLCERQPFL